MARATARSHVWGTGVIHPDYGIGSTPSSQIYALRGQLSHSAMRRGGIMVGDIPLGDPAYLAPRLLGINKSLTRKFRVGLVSHYVDRSNPIILRILRETGVADLNVHDLPDVFLARMAECQTIVSSSLHGLVFAEALDIPNLWIKASDDIVGGEFKFKDWFSTVRFPQDSVHVLTTGDTAEALAERATCHESTIDADALTAALPLDRLEEMSFPSSRHNVPVLECRRHPTPVFLISFNRVDMLKRAISSIKALTRQTEIVIHDEGSRCAATLTLLEELKNRGVKVFRYPPIQGEPGGLDRVNHTLQRYFEDWGEPCRYVVADCSIDISSADPGLLDVCDELLNTYRDVECLGPMLRIRDIPRSYPLFNQVMNREIEQFWQHMPTITASSVGDVAVMRTRVNAKFALHRAGEPFRREKSTLLVYEPFEAICSDWYKDEPEAGSSPAALADTRGGTVVNRPPELAFSDFYAVRKTDSGGLIVYKEQMLGSDRIIK